MKKIDHLVAGCPIRAAEEYKERHDKMGQYPNWRISQHYNAPYAGTNIAQIQSRRAMV